MGFEPVAIVYKVDTCSRSVKHIVSMQPRGGVFLCVGVSLDISK